jgi:hypothetical protein
VSPSLDGPRLKVGRAQHHLDELKTAIVSLLQPNPERIVGHLNDDATQWIYPARRTPTTRIAWSAMLGDVLNNYRSALDYTVAELVLKAGNTVTKNTSFPIIDDSQKWTKVSRSRTKGIAKGSDVPIRAVQPYHCGNLAKFHPLALLRDLNNWDKHQAIHTTVQVARGRFTGGGIFRGGLTAAKSEAQEIVSGPFERGDPLASHAVAIDPNIRTSGEPELDRPLEVVYDIAFQGMPPNAQSRSVIETLEAIATCVEDTIPQFEKFF